MTIKKTILDFMAATILMSTAACQASTAIAVGTGSEVTITQYNQATDEQFALKQMAQVIKIVPSYQDYNENELKAETETHLKTMSDTKYSANYIIRYANIPVGIISIDLQDRMTQLMIPVNHAHLIPDAINCIKSIHEIICLMTWIYEF